MLTKPRLIHLHARVLLGFWVLVLLFTVIGFVAGSNYSGPSITGFLIQFVAVGGGILAVMNPTRIDPRWMLVAIGYLLMLLSTVFDAAATMPQDIAGVPYTAAAVAGIPLGLHASLLALWWTS